MTSPIINLLIHTMQYQSSVYLTNLCNFSLFFIIQHALAWPPGNGSSHHEQWEVLRLSHGMEVLKTSDATNYLLLHRFFKSNNTPSFSPQQVTIRFGVGFSIEFAKILIQTLEQYTYNQNLVVYSIKCYHLIDLWCISCTQLCWPQNNIFYGKQIYGIFLQNSMS